MKCGLGQHQRDGSEHLKEWAGVAFGVLWKSPDPGGLDCLLVLGCCSLCRHP